MSESRKVLVIAPHADDETLGCGGTIFTHRERGDEVHWLLVTGKSIAAGFDDFSVMERSQEIEQVASVYGFASVTELNLAPAELDQIPEKSLINKISNIISNLQPEHIYTAYRNDAHSDHKLVFDAVMASTKAFRAPYVRRLLVYETLSETEFGLKPEDSGFRPNIFIDIEEYLEKKVDTLKIYKTEISSFPFPRSEEAVVALAVLRGVQCNAKAAEAFMLIKGIGL